MSTAVKIPYTIVYKSPGSQGPVFLAGSFTHPEWLQQEMEPAMDDHGDRVFKATVLVEPARTYQFRFKMGHQGSWLVDERKPIAENGEGGRSNFLNLPLGHHSRRHSLLAAAMGGDDDALASVHDSQPQAQPKSEETSLAPTGSSTAQEASTPIEQVAATAAEVADAAEKLDDEDEASPPQVSVSGDESEIEDDLKTPLFAHECFGAYAFADDELEQGADLESQHRRHSRAKSSDYAINNHLDLNDPTLERFPSEKSSVLDTLRKIQSSLGEDRVHLDDPALRRTSIDSTDSGGSAAGSLNSTTNRKRDDRMSSGNSRKRSVASLGSIAEEPKPQATEPVPTSQQQKRFQEL